MLKIVEILPGCGREPIWVTCQPSGAFPGAVRVMVSHDKPPFEAPCYQLQIPCREADVNLVAELYRLECGADREGRRKPFAEDVDTACVECEGCALRDLTLEEAFFPLFGDELAPNKSVVNPHWNA
jgi:hypothetical protein